VRAGYTVKPVLDSDRWYSHGPSTRPGILYIGADFIALVRREIHPRAKAATRGRDKPGWLVLNFFMLDAMLNKLKGVTYQLHWAAQRRRRRR
jgi:hypothetical protein